MTEVSFPLTAYFTFTDNSGRIFQLNNRELYRFLQDLWQRTGGGVDNVAELQESVEYETGARGGEIASNTTRIRELEIAQSQINDLSALIEDLRQKVNNLEAELVETQPPIQFADQTGVRYSNISNVPAPIDAIDGLSPSADTIAYYTGGNTAALTDFTSQARQLMDDTTFSDMRATIGLGSADNVTFATVDTGQGANELYPMNQAVQSTDAVTFDSIDVDSFIDLINNGSIRASGTAHINFDGSGGVSLPNGNLTLDVGSLFMDMTQAGFVVDQDSDTGNSRSFIIARKDGNVKWLLIQDYDSEDLYWQDGSGNQVERFDQGGNVDFPSGTLSEQGTRVAKGDGTTGGTGSAGSGNQFVEIEIAGTTYKVLHDGTV